MAKRWGAVAALTLAALALSAPAQAQVVQDLWSGVWTYSADRGKTHGTLTLTLADDGVSVSGEYESATSGRLRGTLDRPYGPVLCGSFRDLSGKFRNRGSFCATMQSDAASFRGWYKPCRVLCFRQRWYGDRS